MSNAAPTKVVTGKVRLSYVNIFTPRVGPSGGDPKYSVCVLIPKSDKATVDKVKAAVEAAKQAGTATFGGKVPAGVKSPLRDGDTEREGPEYKGHYFINCNSKQRPNVVDAAVNPILSQDEVYSGCYGRVSINFYAYNQSGNKGVGAGLQNVQKIADGDPLSGRSRAEDDFSAVDEDFLS
ncbi:MAG: DUF2815 family protein [Betaproteobacteria bacterium]|nr:DUF2815 family protein [Betaproteobacteria bacterium]